MDIKLILLAGLILIPFVIFLGRPFKSFYSIGITVLFASISSYWAIDVFMGNYFSMHLIDVPTTGSWVLKIDLLSAFFILIVNFVTVLGSIYSVAYFRENKDKGALNMHFMSYNILHISMLLVCMIQNFIPFLILWETMSLSSLLLVIFQFKKENTLKAGLNYLIQMHIGVVLLSIGFQIVSNHGDINDFVSLGRFFATQESNLPIFMLLFLGFGFKVGFLPLHSWMPYAYPAAPAHVAAVMSGVMKKLGLYGILRLLLSIHHSHKEIGLFMLVLGIMTALYGIINAIMQKDIKKMLAYSSMENMGIIAIALGIGTLGLGLKDYELAFLGFTGALLQMLNHSLFKPLLFLATGSIYQKTHTRNIELLGGLAKKMPATSVMFLIGSLAICGLPPFNGFLSEYIIYSGLLEGLNATYVTTEVVLLMSLIIMALVGGLSIYAYTKLFGLTFLGTARSAKTDHASEVSLVMLIPQFIMVLFIIAIGLLPTLFYHHIGAIVDMFLPSHHITDTTHFYNIQKLGFAGIIFLGIALVVFLIRSSVKSKVVNYGPTWGCGYEAATPKLQYTSGSFADYMAKLATPILFVKEHFKQFTKKEIFPADRDFQTETGDMVEHNFITRGVDKLNDLLRRMAVIQTGQIQNYIMYAFVFMIILFLITFLDII